MPRTGACGCAWLVDDFSAEPLRERKTLYRFSEAGLVEAYHHAMESASRPWGAARIEVMCEARDRAQRHITVFDIRGNRQGKAKAEYAGTPRSIAVDTVLAGGTVIVRR